MHVLACVTCSDVSIISSVIICNIDKEPSIGRLLQFISIPKCLFTSCTDSLCSLLENDEFPLQR